jgi:hypothetical protein
MAAGMKTLAALLLGLMLAGCANNAELRKERRLGAFELGFNVVIADNAQTVPGSRVASEEQLETVIAAEIDRRFSRYDGGRFYHIGINVEGYLLAPPGIPVIAAPKSALIISVNIFDDALQKRLTPNGKQFTVLESFSGDAIVGSGFTMTADEQLLNLAQNAAAQIETWLEDNPDWFDYPVDRAPETLSFEEQGIDLDFEVTEIPRGAEGVARPAARPGDS